MPKYRDVSYVLKKRPDRDSWQSQFYANDRGVRKRYRFGGESAEEARAAAEKAIDRLSVDAPALAPKAADFGKPTLQKMYELVYSSKWKGTKGEQTAVKNAKDCIAILGGDTRIDQIGTADIDRLVTELKEREVTRMDGVTLAMSPGTIRRKLAALSTILKFACSRNFIATVPLIDRSQAGKERKRVRYIRDEEERTGLDYLKSQGKKHEFFAFLIDTGFRLNEALSLEDKNVRRERNGEAEACELLDQEMIKNGEFRIIPCTERVREIMKDRLKGRPQGDRRIWWDMTVKRAEWDWNLMRKKLGLDTDRDFVIHACRHTFASRLVQTGAGLDVVKVLGGWRTLEMVLRYGHQNQAASVDAIRRMQQPRLKIG